MTALSMPVVWGITIAVLLVVEAATMGLTTIWFAGGALAALILAILHAPVWLQIGVFAAVSILLLFMTRPLEAAFLT
ncbi:MAG: NfeD family protein, partial [Lachnospiraceae bacterium]|nr:NfeD family protein [Lachnospiraceae bacterium]